MPLTVMSGNQAGGSQSMEGVCLEQRATVSHSKLQGTEETVVPPMTTNFLGSYISGFILVETPSK